MTRYTLHVPLQLNDGTEVSPFVFGEIESELDFIAGGWTRLDGTGGWYSGAYPDGRSYREPMALYVTDSDEPIRGDLLDLARWVRGALDQEAVYVTEQEIAVHFVTADDREPVTA